MIDSRFFDSLGPVSVADLAALTGAVLNDPALASRQIDGVAPLAQAGSAQVAYALDARRLQQLQSSGAGACFLEAALAEHAPPGCAVLVTPRPHMAWVNAAAALHRVRQEAASSPAIHSTARIENGVVLQPGVVVGADAAIGAGTRIGANTVIGRGVTIGRNCSIGPNVSIGFSLVGDSVVIAAGARIGESGFGVTAGPQGPVDIPQLGRVIIQNGVSIGASTCIDRGAWDDTVIGENTKIDNLVQIAHNVRLGRSCLVAAQTGISGSVVVGDGAAFGGQVGIADHINIGAGSSLAASAGVLRDIPAGEVWGGTPARPIRQWLRESAMLTRLTTGGGSKGTRANEP